MALRLLLESQGFEVGVAATGKLGVEVARRWVPDFVVLDIGLPGMDGYEVAKALHADPTTADITIIAVSAHDPSAQPEREQAAGFSVRFVKPVPTARLLSILAQPACARAEGD